MFGVLRPFGVGLGWEGQVQERAKVDSHSSEIRGICRGYVAVPEGIIEEREPDSRGSYPASSVRSTATGSEDRLQRERSPA